MNVKYVLSISLLGSVLLVNQAGADDNVISNVVTTTNGGFDLNGYDSLTTTETGQVNVTNTPAVRSMGNSNTIINQGSLSTTGNDAYGIHLDDSDENNVVQSGNLSTTGDDAYGIHLGSNSDNNIITQSGSITTTGTRGHGLELRRSDGNNLVQSGSVLTTGHNAIGVVLSNRSDNNVITQSGSISTRENSGHGIALIDGQGNNVTQSGSISTIGEDARGIVFSNGDNSIVNQSGSISTSGGDAHGILLQVDSDNNTFTLSGSISTTGVDAHGISVTWTSINNIFHITGLLTSAQANAVLLDNSSTGNALNFTPSAFLGGAIRLGTSGNFVNISTTPSHSVVWDFGATSVITNGIQVSGSGAYVVNNNIFYSVDTTALLGRADALGDAANLVSGVTASRLGSLGSGSAAFEQTTGFAYTQDDGSVDYSDARFWGDFIGSISQYGATNTTLGYKSHQYGLALGYERDFDTATTFGLMGGYLGGKMKAQSRFMISQETDSQGGFAGIYGSRSLTNEITLSGSLMVGRSNNDSKRTFNKNTVVPAFTETASGSYDSTFLVPSISISTDYALDERTTLTPTLSALYAHQWSEGYTETGSSANLTVGAGQESVFEAKAEFGIARQIDATERHNGGHITARLGAMVRATPNNGTPTLSFAGIGTLTNTNNDKGYLVAATAGLDFNLKIKDNMSLTATGDIAVGNNNYFNAQGKLGLKVQF